MRDSCSAENCVQSFIHASILEDLYFFSYKLQMHKVLRYLVLEFSGAFQNFFLYILKCTHDCKQQKYDFCSSIYLLISSISLPQIHLDEIKICNMACERTMLMKYWFMLSNTCVGFEEKIGDINLCSPSFPFLSVFCSQTRFCASQPRLKVTVQPEVTLNS